MLTVIKNVMCFSPNRLGLKNIILAGGKIIRLAEPDSLELPCEPEQTIDGNGLMAFPGIIDGHVHIIGGGGEQGFESSISEISPLKILEAGVTTLVGLLGADDRTKNLFSLFSKAKALEKVGITTRIYSGSYAIPALSLTGDIINDMILIDKVVGVGEIALSDHRSSYPDMHELLRLASDIHRGGMLAGKPGLLHFHMGDGKEGLSPLVCLLEGSDLPSSLLLPTHVNRSRALFDQAIDYVLNGGNIDLTSDERSGLSIPDAVDELIKAGVDMHNVTASSDANGSIPGGGVGDISTLLEDITRCITEKDMNPETVFPLVTENAARRLGLYPQKGALLAESDADILLLNENYKLKMLFSGGELKIDNRKRNRYE